MPQFEIPKSFPRRCSGCGRSTKLKLCAGCSNAAYCSKQCQREHLPTHKPNCDPVHLDLSTFYPVIAWIAEFSRLEREDWHPALLHRIDQAPLNPPVDSEMLPDGSEACLIDFGIPMHKIRTVTFAVPPKPPTIRLFSKPMNHTSPPERLPSLYTWWQRGPTDAERAYLRRRISREGHLLPLLIGAGVALLLELFSTAVSDRRTCLHYRGKPIYDFGIYHGSIRVDGHRTFAYSDSIDDDGKTKPERFQDPQNHFWLYFQIEDTKEEIFLDLGLFVYGYRNQITNADYYLPRRDLIVTKRYISQLMDLPSEHTRFIDPCTPALLADKAVLENVYMRGLLLHKKKNKFSMLRNEEFLAGLSEMSLIPHTPSGGGTPVPRWKFTRKSVDAVGTFMVKADKEAQTLKDMHLEMNILLGTILNGARIVKHVLADETWKRFPEPLLDLSRWELDTE